MKKLIIGNWKMNGSIEQSKQLIADIINQLDTYPDLLEKFEFVVCPPFNYIYTIKHAAYYLPHVKFGGQNCSQFESGAYTGEISAAMLADQKCKYVIVGHSERRQHLGETNEHIKGKVEQAQKADLIAVLCVGETQEERDSGKAQEVVEGQLKAVLSKESADPEKLVVAYEPVWAIGSGQTPSDKDITEMHGFISGKLKEMLDPSDKIAIVYGGSVKAENGMEILALENVDGVLVGGASLDAQEFVGIVQ